MSQQPLLPSDRYLMQVLAEAGVEITEDDWRSFKAEVRRRALEGPQPAVVAGVETLAIIAIVSSLLSVGLTIVASFFKPKPGKPAQLEQNSQQGTSINSQRRYVPRTGFDAVQEPASIGSTIPLVYTLRESYGNGTYGGVRVNMPLLWSQVQSYGGSQLLRAIFLLSEGEIHSLDLRNFAIGNNAISSYDLLSSQANQLASRLTVYWKPNGGRIRSADRVLGRSPGQDQGNAENFGGPDVFAVQRATNWNRDFSSSNKPNTQTTFGVYSLIGNNLGFRINPSMKPEVQPNLIPQGNDGDAFVACTPDIIADAQRNKFRQIYSSRSGLIRGSVSGIGLQVFYRLDNSSDAGTVFRREVQGNPDYLERHNDVASAVASRQRAWDDALVVGDLYKIGSALAVCTARNPSNSLFESEQDFLPLGSDPGQAIEATFTTVRPGIAQLTNLTTLRTNGDASRPPRFSATNFPHVYRIAVANVSTSRPCQVVEIGIRSSLGIRITGLCNFADSLSYSEIDGRACIDYSGTTIRKGETLKTQVYQSGVVSSSEERYSFFRISYREAGTDNGFTNLAPCFGIRSITQQNAYNSIRFQMPDLRQWEFRIEPLTGWEIRSGVASGNLEVIDSKLSNVRSIASAGLTIIFNGVSVPRSQSTFTMNITCREPNKELGLGFTDGNSYADAWGKLAEAFVYEEIQSTATSPEHEIVYVNEIVPNQTIPNYDNLSIVGLNVRSSLEFQQFAQFSAYVTGGIICRRLLQSDTPGPTHLFPDVLLDLLTNPRYGRGDLITDELIDFESFRQSAQWCQERGYFFDGAIVGRENLRQWAADVAATHLLIFGEANGRFFLRPAFSLGQVPIKALFTAGNIREGSFRLQYLEAEERQPIQVSVRYREERASTNLSSPGLFPLEREILVREASTPDTASIESIDISDYGTNPQQAIDAAKFVARFRRLSTHGIRFETTYEGILASLAPGDFIRCAMDTNVYDDFNNGVVTPNGALVSTQQLNPGSYSVFAWNGDNGSPPSLSTLNVAADGLTATPTGIVFTLVRADRQVQTYQVESIEPNDEGYLAIEAVHMPTNSSGVLRLVDGLFSDTDWIIRR